MLPAITDRLDRGVFRADGPAAEGVIAAIHREWRDYPSAERREVSIYIACRIGDGMTARFRLTILSHQPAVSADWTAREIPVPSTSTCLQIDGSGRNAINAELRTWQASTAADTSRAVFSGFVDAVISGVDPDSGGAPQLGCLYRIGAGRLLGIVHHDQRYFAGTHLIGDEDLGTVEWRNALFERADGHTKSRLPGAHPHSRPTS